MLDSLLQFSGSAVQTVIAGLLLIGILVIVHEAGHYVVAKLLNVGAPVFSVGMGPRIFGFHWKGTDFRISALPIGGYVQLAGADAFGEEDAGSNIPAEENFSKRPVWQRLAITFAGPGVNLLLPFVIFTFLFMLGHPEPSSRIGTVYDGSPAAEVGLSSDELITSIDGAPVTLWYEVEEKLTAALDSKGESIKLGVGEGGQVVTIPISTLRRTLDGKADLESFGLSRMKVAAMIAVEEGDSPAALSGLRQGDYVRTVDGEEIKTWQGLNAALAGKTSATFSVDRYDEEQKKVITLDEVTLQTSEAFSSDLPMYGNPWGLLPSGLVIVSTTSGSAAEEAGLQEGDVMLAVDEEPLFSFPHLINEVGRHYDPKTEEMSPVNLMVYRDGELLNFDLTPRLQVVPGEVYPRPLMGVSLSGVGSYFDGETSARQYGPIDAVKRGSEKSVAIIAGTGRMLVNLFTRQANPRDSVGGPVALFQMASEQAEQGFFAFAGLIGFVSVSLGLVNLLPVPVLDGGQILFYLIEGIRGRPLSLELRERFQMMGVVALMIVMLLVFANDITRWVASAGGSP